MAATLAAATRSAESDAALDAVAPTPRLIAFVERWLAPAALAVVVVALVGSVGASIVTAEGLATFSPDRRGALMSWAGSQIAWTVLGLVGLSLGVRSLSHPGRRTCGLVAVGLGALTPVLAVGAFVATVFTTG